jgi:hypothetical protein
MIACFISSIENYNFLLFDNLRNGKQHLNISICIYFLGRGETVSHYVIQAGLVIFLPLLLECWNFSCAHHTD